MNLSHSEPKCAGSAHSSPKPSTPYVVRVPIATPNESSTSSASPSPSSNLRRLEGDHVGVTTAGLTQQSASIPLGTCVSSAL